MPAFVAIMWKCEVECETEVPMREQISACVIAGNEELRLGRCLESVRWADEIVVIDSFSSDRTVTIARQYTDRVFQHEWRGYIGQKNLIRRLSRKPWILFIDADEVISEELRREILREFEAGASQHVCGYEFPRMVRYIGKWIRHGEWYPDVKLRLFRVEKGRCAGTEPHDKVQVDGPIKRLAGQMYHFTYEGIHDHVAQINDFSSITARGQADRNRPLRLSDLILRPPCRFLKAYFLKRGFMDGIHGFLIALIASYGVFIKYAKQWEAERAGEPAHRDGPPP